MITSASTTGLVSNKLGFPYLGKAQDANYRQQCAKLFAGRNKTTHPVVMNIDATNKTIVYQPIFKEIFDSKKHDVPYVHRHSYDYDARLGGIFVQRNNNQIRYLDKEDKVNLIPKAQTKDKLNLSIRRVFELQNYTVVDMFKIDTLSADYRRYLNACVRNNEKLIEYENKLKQTDKQKYFIFINRILYQIVCMLSQGNHTCGKRRYFFA